MNDGREDVRRAAEDLAGRLPDALAPLARIAYNYRWSWLPGGPEVFKAVDAERFALTNQNPVRLLQETSGGTLRRAAADDGLLERIAAVEGQVRADLDRPPYPSIDPARPVAFLCAEYGIHVSMPIYSGGLGALAGDLLKEASDCAIPFVAVGLMYRRGYFRQRIDAGGWQHEYWIETDPQRLPAALVTGPDEKPVTIEVPIYDVDVTAQIWRVDVGRVPLFLLDTDMPSNGPLERWITGRLYESDEKIRLAQYVLLGAGGVRALTAVGVEPGVIHLNEGHAALAPVQLAAQELHSGEPLATGIALARERTVFTTHTPVPAGNDTYTPGAGERRDRPLDQPARRTGRRGDRAWAHPPGGRGRAVRRHPGGVAHEPRRQRREPSPRRGGPRDVAPAVARARSGRCSDRLRD